MNNEAIMVSVFCIAYNHEPYIKYALDGILMQKANFRYEVIVHDDASTDRTADIIREYEKKHPNIIKPIYQKENQYSKNIDFMVLMALKAKGKYIALCEGDDFWIDEKKLSIQIDFLENNPEYIACGHNEILYNCQEKRIKDFHGFTSTYDTDVKPTDNLVSTATLVYRAEYETNRPSQFDYSHTARHFWLCINGKMRFLSRVMSFYRRFSLGSWNSKIFYNINLKITNYLYAIQLYENVYQFLNNEHDKKNVKTMSYNEKISLFYVLYEKSKKKDNQKLLCEDDNYFKILSIEYKNFIQNIPFFLKLKLNIRAKRRLFSIINFPRKIINSIKSKHKIKKQWKILKFNGMIPSKWSDFNRPPI